MEEKTMERVEDRKTLAYRLHKGDKLWIDGYFVELVKVPRVGDKKITSVCGFNGKCKGMVKRVCMELGYDALYLYAVGKVGQQNVEQQIVEPKD